MGLLEPQHLTILVQVSRRQNYFRRTAATFSVHNMFTATNLVSSEQRFFSSEHVYSLDTLDA